MEILHICYLDKQVNSSVLMRAPYNHCMRMLLIVLQLRSWEGMQCLTGLRDNIENF